MTSIAASPPRPSDPQPALSLVEQYLGALPDRTLENLRQADRRWAAIKAGSIATPQVVHSGADRLDAPDSQALDYDVIIGGATLGVFIGAALAQRGWRVALVERGILRGRVQEWNISRHELETLVTLGLLSAAELEQAIATEYNPGRIAFQGGEDIWIRDVLNLGVDPVVLLELLKQKFLAAGGTLLEQTAFEGVTVHPNGVAVRICPAPAPSPLSSAPTAQPPVTLTGRLMLDAMGHGSPIAQQARQGQKPDAVCLVVGTCAQGYPDTAATQTGDLFASFTPIADQRQYFWEAFPARDGRTTYLFTYLDAHPDRPSLEQLFEDYFRLLPQYQGVNLDQLQIQRALFGILPSYRHSPLQLPWDRLLAIGDSSGNQSPLSFGGFGALLRHLERLDQGIDDALSQDCLSRSELALLQPYQPSLSVTWLFQRSMSVGVHQNLAPDQINRVLAAVFTVMERSGLSVLKPFMQDVVQFPALAQTMFKVGVFNPLLVPKLLPQIGLPMLLDWFRHYLALGGYSLLWPIADRLEPLLRPQLGTTLGYRYRQWLQALKFGSGQDYHP
ncbi:MAG: FAD-dependent oxidoreductase [Prochlorothrix sp.]